jgi:fucose 4-O-acetylase-like acetyltransferase
MLLVIVAHTLINSYDCVGQEMIRFFCLCYTMPLFTFISGYLSKPQTSFKKNVKHLLLPCIVISVVNNIVMLCVNPDYHITKQSLLTPGFAMWYLWALFVFRTTLPYLLKIPHVILLSLVISWVVGFANGIGSLLSLSRIICFLPYFLIGYALKQSVIKDKLLTLNYLWGG